MRWGQVWWERGGLWVVGSNRTNEGMGRVRWKNGDGRSEMVRNNLEDTVVVCMSYGAVVHVVCVCGVRGYGVDYRSFVRSIFIRSFFCFFCFFFVRWS